MDIARMNVRIMIQKNEARTDAYGNHTSVWADYFSCWASCRNQTGTEQDDAGQTLEEDRMDFTVRYCGETAAVTSTGFRILMGGRIYDIDHVDDMNIRKHSMKFHAALARR